MLWKSTERELYIQSKIFWVRWNYVAVMNVACTLMSHCSKLLMLMSRAKMSQNATNVVGEGEGARLEEGKGARLGEGEGARLG